MGTPNTNSKPQDASRTTDLSPKGVEQANERPTSDKDASEDTERAPDRVNDDGYEADEQRSDELKDPRDTQDIE